MNTVSFPKMIYLPSGGLDYSPFVWLYPLTNSILLLGIDPNSADSNFDWQLVIIKKFLELKDIDVIDMYACDFHYIWFYITSLEFHKDGILLLDKKCSECEEENNISVDLGIIGTNYYDRFGGAAVSDTYAYEIDDVKIIFYRRRVKHNLHFSHISYINQVEDPLENLKNKIILFVISQIKCIINKDNNIPEVEYFDVLSSFAHEKIIDMFNFVSKEEVRLGLENDVYFNCKECKAQQKILIFDDFNSSQIFPPESYKSIQEQEDGFKGILEVSRLPMFNYEQYLRVPLRYAERMGTIIRDMKFVPMI